MVHREQVAIDLVQDGRCLLLWLDPDLSLCSLLGPERFGLGFLLGQLLMRLSCLKHSKQID